MSLWCAPCSLPRVSSGFLLLHLCISCKLLPPPLPYVSMSISSPDSGASPCCTFPRALLLLDLKFTCPSLLIPVRYPHHSSRVPGVFPTTLLSSSSVHTTLFPWFIFHGLPWLIGVSDPCGRWWTTYAMHGAFLNTAAKRGGACAVPAKLSLIKS